MVKVGLLVRLEAKPGKEQAVADFIKSALTLVEQEPFTMHWFAIQLGASTFGIFDTFEHAEARNMHLGGLVAQALMAHAPELLAVKPIIERVDLLAVK